MTTSDRNPTDRSAAAGGPPTAGHEPLAIIGMAVRLPGADDLDAYWRLVVEGRSAIGELPPERLDRELFFDPAKGVRGQTYSSIGGIVSPRTEPPGRWRLTPEQAADCDPAHLELCEVTAAAFRHAGLDPAAVPDRRAGVYVGHTRGTGLGGDLMYGAMLADTAAWLAEVEGFAEAAGGEPGRVIEAVVARERERLPRRLPGGGPRLDAQRCSSTVSQAFGLDGPCVALNAACSSSLFALAAAADDLLLGRSEMAVVAGSSHCRFDSLVLFSKAQSVSATGSRPFDASADGLVTAEGYVVVLVKTLRRALADGNPVQAVIRGVGVASDGRGKSLWAPREEGQTEAIRRAHADLLDPARLGYVEAHATSTSVGDATEVRALARALRAHVPAGRRIPIGSVKANIGHTLETAGLAGLVKAVLCMQHATIPPMPHVETLNPDVDWEASPFQVPREPQPWPAADGLPRRVAVNSFGIGGLNAHVVLDEFTGTVPRATVETPAALAPAAFAPVPSDDAVAIVGLAALAPGSLSAAALWDLVGSDRRPFSTVPTSRWDVAAAFDSGPAANWRTPQKLGGFIEGFAYDWRAHKIPPKQIAAADPLQFMLLDTVSKALADAGHPDRPLPQARTGVVVGTVFGGDFAVALQIGMRLPFFQAALERELAARGVPAAKSKELGERFADLVIERLPALADETGSFTSSSLASRITKTFDLMGGATAIDGGAASAVAALDICRNFLLTGRVDCMICAAGQRSMTLATYEQLSLAGTLSRSGVPRPFEETSDGLLPAEGTAVLVLKRLSDARRDGDRIHAIIRGLGTARAADPAAALTTAIERSLAEAGLPAGAVAAVEAAAAGVAAADRIELEAIRGVYGTAPVGTLAPRIGHALGASAGLSIVKAASELDALTLRDGVAGAAERIKPISEQPLEPTADGRLVIGLDAVHFDMAHHLLLERGAPVPAAQRPSQPARPAASHVVAAATPADPSTATADEAWRIVRLSAPTVSELLAAADACASEPATAFAAAAPNSAGSAAAFSGPGHRLAIVARSADELATKARLVTTQFENPEARGLWETRGIALGEATGRRPLVACLFPGQGSQYPGMLRDLVAASPAAAAARARIDAALEPLGYPSFETIVADADGHLGHDVFRTQLAMLVADTIQFAVLADLGLAADRVTGHSYGEFAALHAAGAWDFATAARATFLRCRSICEAPAVNGVMLSCAADEEVVAAACAAVGGDVFVSNCNSAQQTVVGGRREQVVELAGVLGERGVTTKLLDVPRPFHTPLMRDAEEPFRAALAGVRIDPPRIPVLSSVHNRYVAEPAEIRELLVEQLTRPVRYVAQIERLIAEGVGVFVEAGPERVLAKLTRRIVGDRPAAVIAADVRSRSPRDTGSAAFRLAALRGALEVTGVVEAPAEKGVRHLFQQPGPAPTAEREKGVRHLFPEGERAGLLTLAGTPAEMGLAHGRTFAAEIRAAVTLLADLPPAANGRLLDPAAVLDAYETMTKPEQREELRGIAAGAGVAYESLVAMHVRIDPSLEGGCVQAVFPAAVTRTGRMLQGANEDLPAGLVLRDGIRRCVQLRRPAGRLASITFTAIGVSAGINGMNETGLVVTSSMLLDQPPRSGPRRGLMHSALVDRVLSTARSAAEAVAIIRAAPRDGAWAMLVSEGDGGRMLHVEYDAASVREVEVREPVCLANHSRLGLGSTAVPAHSQARLDRLEQLVTPARCTATAEAFSMMLRDRFDVARQSEVRHATMNTIQRVDNQASVVFDPQARRVLFTVRRPDDGQIEFREIDCGEWFAAGAAVAATPVSRSPVSPPPAPATITTPQPATAPRPAPDAALPLVSATDYARLGTSTDGRSPVDPSDRICTRFLVRLVPWPMADAPPRPLAGRAIVVGTGPVADAFTSRLASLGIETLRTATAADPACTAAIDDLAADCSQLYLLDPLAEPPLESPAADWEAARRRLLDRYQLVQRWFARHEQAGSLPTATLVAATSLGTPGGLTDTADRPIAGGITGLLKGIHTEERERRQQGFHAVVVDLPADAPASDAADWLLAEARQASENPEIVYAAGRRHAVRPVNVPLPENPRENSQVDQPATLAGTWVITGGARGVTAQVARGLGKLPGTVLHLVGSSPVPEVSPAWRNLDEAGLRQLREGVMREALARKELPADAWGRIEKAIEIDATLRGLAAEGIRATYHACDVGDRAALEALLERIRRADGPIRGVIHGAGFEKASRFSRKKPELVDRTVRAKVDGGVNLMAATAGDPLAAFVVFGSISGRFGAVGQTDYCTANECVAKLVRWYRGRRPEVPAVAVAWHSWDEVGMAVRPESKFSKSLLKLRFMPPQEGVEHLLAEIAAGCPEAEVVITDWRYFKLRHPDPLWLPPASPTFTEAAALPAAAPPVAAAPAAATGIRRHVLRLAAAPRPATAAAATFPGPVLVVGRGGDAEAVAAHLTGLGLEVDRLATDGPVADAIAALDGLLAAGRARSLLLLTAREVEAFDITRPTAWAARRAAGVVAPFQIVQRWFAHHARQKQPAMLAAAVALGGDFGISGQPRAPEGAALAGLLKAVRIEAAARGWHTLGVCVVDAAPALPPHHLARELVAETAAAGAADTGGGSAGDIEVAFDALGRRHRVEVVAADAPPASVPPPRAGAAWVAIGGARGITARMALHLARRFGVRMHLVGTSPLADLPAEWRSLDAAGRSLLKQEIAAAAVAAGESPAARWLPIERALEIDATLAAFAAAGLPVTYHACDASDPAALAAVLDRVRGADGPIEGVLQGAGAFERSRLEAKSAANLERLLQAKLDATHALVTHTQQDPLRFFVALGSVAGRFGTNGNADYALASDMQCGLMGWLKSVRPEVHAVGFHWHPWDETGMMMRSASFASREIMKLALLPPAEGVGHLERELLAGTPETQVVITDDGYRAWLAQTVRGAARPGEPAVAPAAPAAPAPASPPPPRRPLVDAILEHEPGRRIVTESRLDPRAEPFLVEHRFRGRPLLPFVIALEMLAEAAATLAAGRVVAGFDEVEIISGLKFVHDQPLPVRVRARMEGACVSAELVSDFVNRQGRVLTADRVHVRGRVVFADSAGPALPAGPIDPPGGWWDVGYPEAREEIIYHGPIFRRITGARLIDEIGWMQMTAESLDPLAGPRRNAAGWILSPAILDACFFGCGLHVWLETQGVVAIPNGVKRLRVGRLPSPGEICVQRVSRVSRSEDRAVFDFVLAGADGRVILAAEGFEAAVLAGMTTS